MVGTFKTSVRRVGTSLGVLIPKDVVSGEHLREGEEVQVGIFRRRDPTLIRKSFGIAKGAKPFQRENDGRDA